MLVLLLLSTVLMVMDYRGRYVQPIRATVSWVTTPLVYLVNWPTRTYHVFQSNIASQNALLSDNQRLRAEVISLQLRLQKLASIQQENKQLRALLSSSKYVQSRVKVGQIISVASNPVVDEIMVDVGLDDGIYQGQPVLDAYGVFGQVIHVSDKLSRVMLLTDRRSAIPVEDSRSGFRAIAEGGGVDAALLHLTHVPQTADIDVGDVFISSGFGGVYPEGYPVGEVAFVERLPGNQFAHIGLKLAAHVRRSRRLLLVWPDQLLGDPQGGH